MSTCGSGAVGASRAYTDQTRVRLRTGRAHSAAPDEHTAALLKGWPGRGPIAIDKALPVSVVHHAGREVEMSHRILLAVLCAVAASGVVSTAGAQASASGAGKWEVPRTPDGHPDLQGNWTNATLTPFEREEGKGPVFTWAEVEELERPSGDCLASRGGQALEKPVACERVDNLQPRFGRDL